MKIHSVQWLPIGRKTWKPWKRLRAGAGTFRKWPSTLFNVRHKDLKTSWWNIKDSIQAACRHICRCAPVFFGTREAAVGAAATHLLRMRQYALRFGTSPRQLLRWPLPPAFTRDPLVNQNPACESGPPVSVTPVRIPFHSFSVLRL